MNSSIGISVITVTKNNAYGLQRTLESLDKLEFKPKEILVKDCLSEDHTADVVQVFKERLPIIWINNGDDGIFDGMNIARAESKGDILHYLNAGDYVEGEPYQFVDGAARLPVNIVNPEFGLIGKAGTSLFGSNYCHQGVLLPRDHPQYDTQFPNAACFDLLAKVFPDGLSNVRIIDSGTVNFVNDGNSSIRKNAIDREIIEIVSQNEFGIWKSWKLIALLRTKILARSILGISDAE